MTQERKAIPFPDWAQKVIGWILLTLIAVYTSSAVSKQQINDLSAWKSQHEIQQRQDAKEQLSRPEFSQFKEDLYMRLDRMEKKLDDHDKHDNDFFEHSRVVRGAATQHAGQN